MPIIAVFLFRILSKEHNDLLIKEKTNDHDKTQFFCKFNF